MILPVLLIGGAIAAALLLGGKKSMTSSEAQVSLGMSGSLPEDLAIAIANAQANAQSLGYEGMMNLQQTVRARGFPDEANNLVKLAQMLPGAPPVAAATVLLTALQTGSASEMRNAADALEDEGFGVMANQLRAAAGVAA